jgi:hypothetical protein
MSISNQKNATSAPDPSLITNRDYFALIYSRASQIWTWHVTNSYAKTALEIHGTSIKIIYYTNVLVAEVNVHQLRIAQH